jgi:HSP20 family molecular chaperone IbpA
LAELVGRSSLLPPADGVGDSYRAFAIQELVDGDKIKADLKNGVLAVHLPKSEAAKPRRIEVKAS